MKIMKKIAAMCIVCSLAFSCLAGCGAGKSKMEGELTISVYKSPEWLETAARKFEDKNPGVTVSIHSFADPASEMDIYTDSGLDSSGSVATGQTREDYLSELNTKILSQEAEDLIMTSEGLPVERYAYMGVFEDLSGYLEKEKDFNEENYFMNIFEACRLKDGGIYQFPLSAMAVPMMTFDNALIENTGAGPEEGVLKITWREALDLAKEMYDKSTLENTFMVNMRGTVGNIFTKAAIEGVDYQTGTVQLDRERLMNILKVFVEMAEYKELPKNWDFSTESHEPFNLRYQLDDEVAREMLFDDHMTALQWEHEDGNVYLCPYYALDFGITSNSTQKELAWEFLKFLSSDEIQTLPSLPWAGVNRKGLYARIAGSCASSEREYTPEEVKQVQQLVEGWVEQISAYRQEDAELITMTEQELDNFLTSKTSALETIDSLERKLQQYVSE